jgi:multicomponent Na+:H+ antiporter subunit C
MELLAPLLVGTLYGTGFYLLLRRNLLKIVFGLALLSNGTNLLIFSSSGFRTAHPPLIEEGATVLTQPYADPLPQALILTAIVITFGLTSFALVLVYRTYRSLRTDDPDELRDTDALQEAKT